MPRGKRLNLSYDTKLDIAARYRAGISTRRIGASLGISRTATEYILAEMGVPIRTRVEARNLLWGRLSAAERKQFTAPATAALVAKAQRNRKQRPPTLRQRIANLEQELDVVRQWAKKRGHGYWCTRSSRAPCSCGLDAALAGAGSACLQMSAGVDAEVVRSATDA